MARPQKSDYAIFYDTYIAKVQADDIAQAIDIYSQPLMDFYTGLPEAKAEYLYAPGKWTVKDLFQHVIDTERVMVYRLLCFSRGDQTPLASFDENAYAANAGATSRTLGAIKKEFSALRTSTDLLLQSLTAAQLASTGTASNNLITVNALAYVVFGHMLHHKSILEERYL